MTALPTGEQCPHCQGDKPVDDVCCSDLCEEQDRLANMADSTDD
jgi:hypothetical protein